MPERPPLPFAAELAELFWDETIPRAAADLVRQLTAERHAPLTQREKWLVEGGALVGALHAVMWLAEHDMVKDYTPPGDAPGADPERPTDG